MSEHDSYDPKTVDFLLRALVNYVRSLHGLDLTEEDYLFKALDGTIKGMMPSHLNLKFTT